jgi:hypothetical protein
MWVMWLAVCVGGSVGGCGLSQPFLLHGAAAAAAATVVAVQLLRTPCCCKAETPLIKKPLSCRTPAAPHRSNTITHTPRAHTPTLNNPSPPAA